jgi:crossover junction endodeoxyribonuclease RuvC
MKCIIGIDPGLAATGIGIIGTGKGKLRHLYHGVIKTGPEQHTAERLADIFKGMKDIIGDFHPSEAGIESIFFARNARSAIPVSEAKGVILLALHQHSIRAEEYPPQAIKQAVVGRGRAGKQEIQEFVRLLLGLSEIPKPDHASDALAAAICHFHSLQILEKTGG